MKGISNDSIVHGIRLRQESDLQETLLSGRAQSKDTTVSRRTHSFALVTISKRYMPKRAVGKNVVGIELKYLWYET